MKSYLRMLEHIIAHGDRKQNRTGIDTYAVFGYQIRCRLQHGYPLLTTKRVYFKAVVHELLWFLQGATNIKYLADNGVHIWDEWADHDGELGPVYGQQWRNWAGIDQIKTVIDNLKTDPFSRRHIVTAWNPSEVDQTALPPCHCFFQFHVNAKNELSCHVYMRSADVFLGVPFNIASYALLTHMVAQVTGLGVSDLVMSFGDLHIYENHLPQVGEQLKRSPMPLPTLRLNQAITNIDDFTFDDIEILDYRPWAAIKGEVAV